MMNVFRSAFGSSPAGGGFPAANPEKPVVATAPQSHTVRTGELHDALPPLAREKFLRLRDEAGDLHAIIRLISPQIDEARSAKVRAEAHLARLLSDPRIKGNGGAENPSAVSQREAVERHAAEQRRLQERYDTTVAVWEPKSTIVSELEKYLKRLPGDVVVLAAPITPSLLKGETPAAAIARVRTKIEELVAAAQAVEDAPQPSSDAKARAVAQIDRLAEMARPSVSPLLESANGRFGFPPISRNVSIDPLEAALAVSAWLNRDLIIARIHEQIDEFADDDVALTDEQRQKKRGQVAAALLAAEREEEALVEMAERAGVVLNRRRNADPRAILTLADDCPAPRRPF